MDGCKIIRGLVFAGIIALAFTACKVQKPGYVGLYVDHLSSVNKSIKSIDKPSDMADADISNVLDKRDGSEADLPVFMRQREEKHLSSSDRFYQQEVRTSLEAISDTIHLLGKQIVEVQDKLSKMAETSLARERLKDLQSADALQKDIEDNKLLQARNDTIHFLESTQQNLEIKAPRRDSVMIERVGRDLKPEGEVIADQKLQDLIPELQDSIRLLKTRLTSLEEQTIKDKEKNDVRNRDKDKVTFEEVNDTTMLLRALYEKGETRPIREQTILKQIQQLTREQSVSKISLSNYVNRSGDEIESKEMVDKRLSHLSDKISQWIPKEKISLQSDGAKLASDQGANDEAGIEIRIHTK